MLQQILDPDNYSFTIHAASSTLVGIAVLAFSVIFLLRDRGTRMSWLFFALSACVGIWLSGFGLLYASRLPALALWWVKFSYIGLCFLPTTLILLVFAVLHQEPYRRRFFLVNMLLSALFLCGAFSTDALIQGLYQYSWGYYPRFGPLGFLFLLYIVITSMYVVILFWTEYRRSTIERTRKRFTGLFIAFAIGSVASTDFIGSFGIPLYPSGYIAIAFCLTIIGYVIYRYRFVDITPELASSQILETMQGIVIVVDLEGCIRVINPVAQAILGRTRAELLGKKLYDLTEFPQLLRSLIHAGEPFNAHEMSWKAANGRNTTVSLSASHLRNKKDSPIGVVYIAHDITERRLSESALRDSEDRFRSLSNASLEGIMIHDQGVIVDANAAFARLFGYEQPEELIGKNGIEFLLTPESRARIYKRIQQQENGLLEVTGVRNDGTTFLAEIYSQPIKYRAHDARIVSCRDITERKRTEELQRESEKKYRTLFENSMDMVFITTYEGKIIDINPAGVKLSGYPSKDALNHVAIQDIFVNPDDRTQLLELLNKNSFVTDFETIMLRGDGQKKQVLISASAVKDDLGKVTTIQGLVRDITEQRKLENQYRQAQKMEAIGQLAGGVAHDFNNILSAIIGYGHLSLLKLRDDDPVKHYINQILQSSDRAAVLTQGLLAFSRKQPMKKELHELNSVIKDFEKFLHRLLREDIEIKILYSDDQPVIMADRGQIEQVIMNLVTNARDAIPNNGRLTINTKVSDMDEAFIQTHGYGKVGNYAVMSVSDTGVGMSKEIQKKIFEPFFTTKEVGKGTGLGLATVYGIVKAHDGFTNVYSAPGQGTTFHVYFPLARTTNAVPNAVERTSVPLKGGSETILLAEDDANLRDLTSVVLRDMGYTVIDAEDGNRAIVRFKENSAAIKLIILDNIMPKKNGLEAYREISAISPKIRCIFISGYSGEIFAKDGRPAGTEYLPKPVNPSLLLTKVREMLDREYEGNMNEE